MSYGDLILLCLKPQRKKVYLEDLISECFGRFPTKFCFSKHPQWPDARKIDRALRYLRKKKMIKGDPQTFFRLTSKGEKQVREIQQKFRQQKLF